MAYTVLARKYRSRSFDEVIGQTPIATTLVNAIKTGRIHHGYLFTGTRGVGKTSMARILAKALNCLAADGPTPTPCCECDACLAIGEGQDIDVVEIDAASNTGVDNIRELRSNTAYRPARSRYKIYIIDEVHMLSTGAFNALLKTLEEPPEHVKFILATTEIQKVPATIQSRCQRFNFRNIGPEDIGGRLEEICKNEGTTTNENVIHRVARLANGSMRDALSILDQLLSVSPEKLTPEVLDEILPPAQDEQIFTLLTDIAGGDVPAVLTDVEAILSTGRGLEVFCNDTIQVTRTLMHVKVCGLDARIVDIPSAGQEAYSKLAACFELSHYVQMIAMLEELRRNVRFSGAGRALTDALMVRLAKLREWSSVEQLLNQLPAESRNEKKKSSINPVPPSDGDNIASPPAVLKAPTDSSETRASRTSPSPSPPPAREPVDAGSISQENQMFDSPPEPQVRTMPERIPVTAELRKRILDDPLVKQTMELFDGAVINMECEVPAAPPGTDESTE